MKLVKWGSFEYEIILDNGEPSQYIEDLISPLVYTKYWQHDKEKYLSFEHKPYNIKNYHLVYKIKQKDNEDNQELKFIMFLVDKAVDYINNLEILLEGDEYENEDN